MHAWVGQDGNAPCAQVDGWEGHNQRHPAMPSKKMLPTNKRALGEEGEAGTRPRKRPRTGTHEDGAKADQVGVLLRQPVWPEPPCAARDPAGAPRRRARRGRVAVGDGSRVPQLCLVVCGMCVQASVLPEWAAELGLVFHPNKLLAVRGDGCPHHVGWAGRSSRRRRTWGKTWTKPSATGTRRGCWRWRRRAACPAECRATWSASCCSLTEARPWVVRCWTNQPVRCRTRCVRLLEHDGVPGAPARRPRHPPPARRVPGHVGRAEDGEAVVQMRREHHRVREGGRTWSNNELAGWSSNGPPKDAPPSNCNSSRSKSPGM